MPHIHEKSYNQQSSLALCFYAVYNYIYTYVALPFWQNNIMRLIWLIIIFISKKIIISISRKVKNYYSSLLTNYNISIIILFRQKFLNYIWRNHGSLRKSNLWPKRAQLWMPIARYTYPSSQTIHKPHHPQKTQTPKTLTRSITCSHFLSS